MLRRLVLLALSVVVVGGGLVPAGAEELVRTGPKPGGFMSDNVTWVGYLPIDAPAVSARVVRVGTQTRLYASGMKGLTIYDVTSPASPQILGHLPLPHTQNEDVEVSDDGSRVIISADGYLLVPLLPHSAGLHVIDTSDPKNPKQVGYLSIGSGLLPAGDHTATCADAKCDFVYGSEGGTYDLTDPAKPKKLSKGWQQVAAAQVRLTQGAHDMHRDATGLISTDTVPRLILDPRPNPDKPSQSPANPSVVARSSRRWPTNKNLAYQHNSERPRAELFEARDPANPDDFNDPVLRDGELLIANGETNLQPRCNGTNNGPIATWSMRNFDRGQEMTVLEVFRPSVNGTYADGNPAANVLGCSGHYFDERDNVVAAAWFEHGTRFISVDPTNGKMKEVGYFQPVVGSAGAAYWVDDEYVFVTDYVRGIDILKFDREAPAPTAEQISASWLAKLNVTTPIAERERYLCRLATE